MVGALALILGGLGLAWGLHVLDEALGKALRKEAAALQESFRADTGLTLHFGGLSPSILRGLTVADLSVADPSGRVLFQARRAGIGYDLRAVLGLRKGAFLSRLWVEDGEVDLDPESLARLQAGRPEVAGRSEAEAAGAPRTVAPRLPSLAISCRRISLRYADPSLGALGFDLESLDLSAGGPVAEVAVAVRISPSSTGKLGLPPTGLRASGTLARDFSRADLALQLTVSTTVLKADALPLDLHYAGGRVSLSRPGADGPTVRAEVSYDSPTRLLSAELKVDHYSPARDLRATASGAWLGPWLGLVVTAEAKVDLPLGEASAPTYALSLSGRLPKEILDGDNEISMKAAGRGSVVDFQEARLKGPSGEASFVGSLDLLALAPEGRLSLDLALSTARLPLRTEVLFSRDGDRVLGRAESVGVGGLELRDSVVAILPRGKHLVVEASTDYPGVSEPLRFDLDLDLGTGASSGRARVPPLPLGPARDLGAALVSPGLADFLKEYTAEGSASFAYGSRGFSFATSDFRLSSPGPYGVSALVSLSGDARRVSLESADLEVGGLGARLQGELSFGPEDSWDLSSRLAAGGEIYEVEGEYRHGRLLCKGSHGLEVDLVREGEGASFEVLAEDLPLPGLGLPARLALALSGRVGGGGDWEVALSKADLDLWDAASGPASGAPTRALSLAGELRPGEARFPRLTYRDRVSELQGRARGSYGAPGAGYTLQASLEGPESESYYLQARLEEGAVQAHVEAKASPLGRFLPPGVHGRFGADLDVYGSLSDLGTSFTLALEGASYKGADLVLGASGKVARSNLLLDRLDAAYQGYAVQSATGSLDLDRGDLRLEAGVLAQVNGAALSALLSLWGRPEASPDGGPGGLAALLAGTQPFTLQGQATKVAYRDLHTAYWPFRLALGRDSLEFSGGGDSLTLHVGPDRAFTLAARQPFPVSGRLQGHSGPSGLEAELTGLLVDLPFLADLLGYLPVDLREGRLSGDLQVRGSLEHPDLEGILTLDGVRVTVPGYVEIPIGPLSAPLVVSGRTLGFSAPVVAAGESRLRVQGGATLLGWIPGDLWVRAATLEGPALSAQASILGLKAQGKARFDLSLGYSGGIATVGGSLILEKARVAIDPRGFHGGGGGPPSTYFDVDLSLGFGPGVKVYFPSPDLPVVTGYIDPSSALSLKYDQEAGNLGLKGTAFLRGGEVFYIQRDFFLKQARIDFNETDDRFDPRITFQAERRARDDSGQAVLITLAADRQPLFSLAPRLSSQPSLSEARIAALLGSSFLGAESGGGSLDLLKAALSGSELLPRMSLAKVFQERIREALGLDVVFVQTTVVQRWLYDLAGSASGTAVRGGLASYLDDSSIYVGKYLRDNVFLHAETRLERDPLVPSGPLLVKSEFGVELESPFGALIWSIAPKTPESLFISDQSLSLTYTMRL